MQLSQCFPIVFNMFEDMVANHHIDTFVFEGNILNIEVQLRQWALQVGGEVVVGMLLAVVLFKLAFQSNLRGDMKQCRVAIQEVCFTLDDPAKADDWRLDLGDVRESAVVWINGQRVATLTTIPFTIEVGRYLQKGENRLQIDVTNLPSNRIAEMERQGVQWRIFKDANIASVTGQKLFSFGDWPTDPSGLNSQVTLTPVYYENPNNQ